VGQDIPGALLTQSSQQEVLTETSLTWPLRNGCGANSQAGQDKGREPGQVTSSG
jgi:hypothetical protein